MLVLFSFASRRNCVSSRPARTKKRPSICSAAAALAAAPNTVVGSICIISDIGFLAVSICSFVGALAAPYAAPSSSTLAFCFSNANSDILSNALDTVSNTLTGFGTTFDQELIENDFITIANTVQGVSEELQISKINSPTSITLVNAPTANVTNGSMTVAGSSDVWNDRFLKRYATALIKYQWGSNLSKFAGIQMPGGVTLDGPRIQEEAKAEIDKLEEEMQIYNVAPNEIYMG